jgi:hypothetical protein
MKSSPSTSARVGLRLLLLSLAIALSACDDGDLRGAVTKSSDGKTYLAVVDDNGGGCGPIIVDGKVWPHKIGEAGPINPGRHKIECGGWIEFDIPQGVIFRFDYWGP